MTPKVCLVGGEERGVDGSDKRERNRIEKKILNFFQNCLVRGKKCENEYFFNVKFPFADCKKYIFNIFTDKMGI